MNLHNDVYEKVSHIFSLFTREMQKDDKYAKVLISKRIVFVVWLHYNGITRGARVKMDFKINVNHNGSIKILQLTDIQIIDANQQRYEGRLKPDKIEKWIPEKNEENIYSHIRYLIRETDPDLIIITGDIIYGEFDDSGRTQLEFIDFMESFKIPWAPVYGNHDNETYKGIEWQCEQYLNAKHCMFERGNVSGNGNYSVGIYQDNDLKKVLYMMDSNGCGQWNVEPGFRHDQLAWLRRQAGEIRKNIPEVTAFAAFHIPTMDFYDALIAAGYQENYDALEDDFHKYEIGKDVPAKNGDFGKKWEGIKHVYNRSLHFLFKECGIDGVFAGHLHKNNFSVLHDGIRYTFGLKTGLFDYLDEEALGGTLITVQKDCFTVKHIYFNKSKGE